MSGAASGAPPTPSDRRPLRWLVAGLLAALAAVAVAWGIGDRGGPDLAAAPGDRAVSSAAAAGVLTGPVEVVDAGARAAAVSAVLDRRARALLARDAVGFAATVDRPGAAAGREDPRRTYAAATLPLARVSYRTVTIGAVDIPGEPGVPAVRVTADLLWALQGYDREDARTPESMLLVHRGAAWRVAAERPLERPAPWQAGRVRVTQGARALVVGVGGPTSPSASTLRAYARLADRTAAAVADLADPGWSGRLVVVVPDTTARAAALLGRPTDGLGRIAAVATADADRGVAGADRIWLNTPSLAALSPLARGIVMRHEAMHLAVAAPSTGTTPMWLEEGLAEFAGYRGSEVPLTVSASDALAERRRDGRLRLPSDADFAAGGDRMTLAYQQAHLAVRLVADTFGTTALRTFYRAVEAGSGGAEVNADAAMRAVLGWDRSTFLARLAGYAAVTGARAAA